MQALKLLPGAPTFLKVRWFLTSRETVVQFLPSSVAIALKEQLSFSRCAIRFLSSKDKCFAISHPPFLTGKQQTEYNIQNFPIVNATVLISESKCNPMGEKGLRLL